MDSLDLKIEHLVATIDRCKQLFDELLRERRQCKIYDFLPILNADQFYPWSSEPLVALFQKQYMIQAALIELQEDYRVLNSAKAALKPTPENAKILMLSPVNVALVDNECLEDVDELGQSIEEAAAMVVLEHYRDYERFFSATSESVSDLLESFWAKFGSLEESDHAYMTLGLSSSASWDEVQVAYRALASEYHPDRGGDHDRFIEIRRAFETLKSLQ